ncbi:phenolic acid decarboxylase [Pseudohyphozyma bogoriensis]|nr:phenolic acid decarboxylase [Pseudohyphozyma bogoriensis]
MSLASSTEPRPIPEHFNEEIQDLHLEYTYDNGPASSTEPRQAPEHFEEELLDVHLEYTYNNGWKYQFWVPNHERVVYSIHGGPMAGRTNFQTAYYQRIREKLWQMSWVEETGTIVSLVMDLNELRITTFICFSKGHWDFPEKAHGWKQDDLTQWRELSKIGNSTTERHVIPEQAKVDKMYKGRGDLPEIDMNWPTL